MRKIKFFFVALCCMALCLSSCFSCGGNSESSEESTESVSSEDSESDNSEQEEQTTVEFNSETDLFAYLSGKTFVCDGTELSIRPDGIYLNGNQITGAVEVVSMSGSTANIQAVSPQTNAIEQITVDAAAGTLTDHGDVYTLK